MSSQSATLPLYADCVANLRTSLGFLDASVATLDAGVADLPRLTNVLKTVRHYELIPQPTLAAAEASLQNDIGPAVAALLDRAEHQLARQARRIDTLQAKASLQAGRLEGSTSNARTRTASEARTTRPASEARTAGRRQSTAEPLRAKMTRQRREQLKYSLARLEREVAQKERELRQRLQQATQEE